MSKFFIRRPIFAIVISLIIVLLGLISLSTLPIAQYPQISPPTIRLSANYTGANASIVNQTVAQVIEDQLNGVEKLDFSGLDLSEDADVFQWCAACNKLLRQQGMLLCGVDIDSDDLQLILVTAAEYDKISALAEQAGHRIAPAETL